MTVVKRLLARLKRLLSRGRTLHYLDVFLAAFVVALAANEQHILDAHGLNAWKSVVEACAVVAAKAVIEAYRNSTPPAAKPTK